MSGPERLPTPRWLLACALFSGAAAWAAVPAPADAAAAASIVAGQPLADALRSLSARHGLTTVFSAERVPPGLRVSRVPVGLDPTALRTALLAEHGLGCRFVHTRCVVEPLPRPAVPIEPAAAPSPPAAAPSPLRLAAVTAATASHYSLMSDGANFMSAADAAATPHLADDVFRLARSIPGVAGGDISAPFHVRGGHADEVALRLDGLELYEPFHLHSLVNALGIVDSNLIGSVDVYTGVQPSRLGGRMSGAIDIRSREVTQTERRLGISAVNTFYTHAQASDDGRQSLLASARRGYLDVVLEFVDPGGDIDPAYHDVFARYQHTVGDRHTLSWQWLRAGDDILITGRNGRLRSDGSSDADYAWLRWQADWSDELSSETLLASTRLDRQRIGFAVRDAGQQAMIHDQRELDGVRLAHRLLWQLDDDTSLEAGGEWRDESARYDYRGAGVVTPLLTAVPQPFDRRYAIDADGRQAAIWLDADTALGEHWQLGAGLRVARYESVAQRDTVLEPHLQLGWQPVDRSLLTFGISRAGQPQRVDELAVEDGDTAFHPTERMRVVVLGWQQQITDRLDWRAELFDKHWDDPRPRYENLFDSLEFFAEIEPDRIRVDAEEARSRGIELGLHGDLDHGRWWLRYTWSQTREREAGRWQPRAWDQPHALHAGWDRQFDDGWRLTTQLDAHSGWPTTRIEGAVDADGNPVISFGPRNGDRFETYLSVSARISREYALAGGDSLMLYFEIFNLLDRTNPDSVFGFEAEQQDDGSVAIDREFGGGLPLVPSFGFLWRF